MYQSAQSGIELLESEYIQQCGETMLAVVLDTIFDPLPYTLDTVELRDRLASVFKACWTEREIAEAASTLLGGPDFETWLGDQE